MIKMKNLFLCLILCISLTVMLLSGCTPSSNNSGSGDGQGSGGSGSETVIPTNQDFYFYNDTVTGFKGRNANPVIPEVTPEGHTVTKLSKEIFKDVAIKTVTIPKTVTEIGQSAFNGCEKLETVYFEGSLADWCSITFDIDASPFFANNSVQLYCGGVEISGDLIIPAGIEEISAYAFYNYSKISSVTIPEGVRTIGNYAFYETDITSLSLPSTLERICRKAFTESDITALELPDSLKKIDEHAFRYNYALETVDFGDGIESIGEAAFANCYKLGNFTLPDSLSELGEGVFHGCQSITSFTLPKAITAVPSSLLGYCQNLTEINLHDGVNEIGIASFQGCTSLAEIDIPDAVTVIPDVAFYDCTSLSYMPIHENITEIGDRAFCNCALKELVLPSHITKLGSGVFYECKSLTSVTISHSVEIGDEYLLFKHCQNIKSADVPFEILGELADSHASIESLVLDDITSVTVNDMSGFTGLKELFLSENLTEIAKGALPESLISLHYNGDIYDWMEVSVNENLSTIIDELYIDGTNVYLDGDVALVIEDGTQELGAYQFCGFKCFDNITMPASLTKIGTSAFDGCDNISRLNYTGTLKEWYTVDRHSFAALTDGSAELKISNEVIPSRVVIGADVAYVGSYTFANQTQIKEVIIENTDVTKVSTTAFVGCTGISHAEGDFNTLYSVTQHNEGLYPALKSVVVKGEKAFNFSTCPNLLSITYEQDLDGFSRRQVEGTAFFSDKSNWKNGGLYIHSTLLAVDPDAVSTSFTVADGTLYIGSRAFDGVEITELTLPEGLLTIGDSALYKLPLTSLTLPDGLLTIGDSALYGLPITELVLPDSLTTLSARALGNMELRSLVIGKSLTNVADDAFLNTSAFEILNKSKKFTDFLGIDHTYKVTQQGYFSNYNGLYTYYNPTVNYNGMKVRHLLSYSGSDLTVIDLGSYSYIEPGAFEGHTEIRELTVGVQVIQADTFKGCTGITKLTLLESVMTIEAGAFAGCGNFTEVTIKGIRFLHHKSWINPPDVEDADDYTPGYYHEWAYESDPLLPYIFNDSRVTANKIEIEHWS